MCALWRFSFGFLDGPGWSRWARTWSEFRTAARGPAYIGDLVNSSSDIVGDVERSVWSDREAARAMLRLLRGHDPARKTVGEYLARTGRTVAGQRLKDHVVAALRVRRT